MGLVAVLPLLSWTKGRDYHSPMTDIDDLVVTFHSRDKETWGVTDGSREEVLSYFEGVHARPRQLLSCPTSWRRWSTADRDPVEQWSRGCATLLGDAAHPMMQYLAQGACMALEDAVTLGAAIDDAGDDIPAALKLYEAARVAHAARVVLSVREMGRAYHAAGIERLVRNSLWAGRSQERFYDALVALCVESGALSRSGPDPRLGASLRTELCDRRER
ncbi:salicylate hydroxylase [Caballeronia ptereochthonis]|uniref:Salicylate hydroxylase n=1 Tax=Caballeronia ptereochthonis TaxID=1777144 RepID=A0A158EAK9_9BURK|nr:salicylate hydroxylase [Caballeronia ptereochthonis]